MNLGFKIAYNSAVQIFGRTISGLINLLVVILLTREFGRATWADYVTITSYIAIFSLIADFGLNSILVREIIEKPNERNHFFQSSLTLRLGLATLAIISSIAILSFTPHTSVVKLGVIIGIFAVLAQGIVYSTSAIFQLLLRFDRGVVADVAGNIFLLVFIAGFSTFHAGIILLLAVFLLANFVKAVVSLVLVKSYVKVGLSFDRGYWKHLLLLSWPLGATAVFSQITANVDKQIVALADYKPNLHLNGVEAVAIYGLAYRLFDFAVSLPSFIVNSAFPALVEKRKESFSALKKLAEKLSLILLGLGAAGAIFGIFVSSYILPVFGNYGQANSPLRLLLVGLPLFFVTSLGFSLLIVLKKQIWLPFIYGFAALFNFAANYYFVPSFGYNASAIITWVTEIVILVPMIFILLYERGVFREAD